MSDEDLGIRGVFKGEGFDHLVRSDLSHDFG